MKQEDKKEIKRQAILKSAAHCFENRRYDEVTLDEVAAGAGVGKGTLYLYFSSKEELFLKLGIEGIDEMVLQIQAFTQMEGEDFEFRFRKLFTELAGFFMRRKGFIRLMNQVISEQTHQQFLQHRQRMQKAVWTFLAQGVKEGSLRSDCELSELDMAIVGPLILRSRQPKGHELVSVDRLINIIWRGVQRD